MGLRHWLKARVCPETAHRQTVPPALPGNLEERLAIAETITALDKRQRKVQQELERILLMKAQQGVITRHWQPEEWEQ